MTTDPILTLAQWLSPAFPVGAFTYSHGLEALVDAGTVHDADSFSAWLTHTLQHGAGQNDVILLAHAYNADTVEELAEIDSLARALAPSAERLLETDQQGAAFARTAAAIHDLDLSTLTYPVAVGRAAQLQNLPLRDTARLFLHAFAANLTSAATRLVPLGQTESQATLTAVTPLCQDVADHAVTLSLDDIAASTFASDIASMRHETQYSRLFRS
ncbi:urease accessory protein UreF [Shimia sp.]|jgi:urease accessory protein|uniref:urease accessory protein UreF n=1 Tax=unclassified Shimia TaxID=2630038 RepID=UPI0025E9C2AC|nr:urease accessory protein UreF [Shimia sp.]MCH2067987.1 urease accessory protein UreF [Shimia sp.]